jgi:hypothetical protein
MFMVTVVDPQWAAPCRPHLLAKGSSIADVDFRLAKGTILHGTVTDGPNHQPLAQAPVNIILEEQRPPGEESKLRGSDGFFYSAFYRQLEADAAGKYELCVGPGTYRIGLPALPEETVRIESQPDIVHDIHIPSSAVKLLAGKVVDSNQQPVGGVAITGLYSSYPYHFHETATTGADGRFELRRELLALTLAAKTPDGKFGALAPVDANRELVTIRLRPLGAAHGRLVDGAGRAVMVGKLEYGLVIYQGGPCYKLLCAEECIPDAEGRYALHGLLPGQYVLNYLPDAQTKLDPQRQQTMPRFSVPDTRHVQLLFFETKRGESTDLGNTPVTKTELSGRPAKKQP